MLDMGVGVVVLDYLGDKKVLKDGKTCTHCLIVDWTDVLLNSHDVVIFDGDT